MPPCKLQERGFWVLEKFHLGTSILSQSSVLWEIPVGLQTPSVRATLQELPLDLPLIIEATTTLTFSDRFALPRRKQLEDDPCRMDYHVPQVPPLYMPEPGGSVTFQLRPAQEQQVLLPSQTTLCKVTPGHTEQSQQRLCSHRNFTKRFYTAPSDHLQLEASPRTPKPSCLEVHRQLSPPSPSTQTPTTT